MDHALGKACEFLSSRRLSTLALDLCQPDKQKTADSILCFLIPKAVRPYLCSYSRCLSEEDRQEVRSYGNIERRLSVSAARVVLRFAISLITNRGSPGDWSFKRTAAGKLQIDNLDGYDCSISYTHELDAVAVSRGLNIGLDVESSRLVVSQDMLQSFFSEGEILQLESCERQRHEGFLRTWVMKEALLKLSGAGLSEEIKLIDTSRCKNLLYTDGLGTSAIVFASRISELTGNSEQGWLSLAHEIRQEATKSITEITFYRLMRAV